MGIQNGIFVFFPSLVSLSPRLFWPFCIVYAADGFVVQTGDPEGPAEGFIDPSTEKTRTIPLEIMADGEKAPFYGATLEVIFNYLSLGGMLCIIRIDSVSKLTQEWA